MKIAYMILAHNHPGHFKRLVKTLKSETNKIFVHIDSKVDIKQFQSADTHHAKFITDRIAPNWGGYSLLLAMLHLLRTAMASGEFDYYQFLSGLDYPIKSDQEIKKFYENADRNSYLFSYPLLPEAPKVEVFTKYYFVDQIARLPHSLHKAGHFFERLINRIFPQRSLPGYMPYRGSQWVCLHRDAAEYTIEFLNTDEGKRFLRFFKFSWGSDEVMFPTLLLNSPLTQRIKYDPYECDHAIYTDNVFALHYIDWDKNREGPSVFDERDFEALQASNALYARKFTPRKSGTLLDHIDLKLRQIDESSLSMPAI